MSDKQQKMQQLLTMFACYPSLTAVPEKQAALMISAYLEKLSTVSVDELYAACRIISSRDQPFPPSAGELLHECLDIRAKRAKADAESIPRIDYRLPIDRLPPEEREASKARVRAMVDRFVRGHASGKPSRQAAE